MLKNKRAGIIVLVIILVIVSLFFATRKNNMRSGADTKEIQPYRGDIDLTVTTTGIIEPQNRLEIKPSISGRIEEIFVQEGDKVKKGEILARMSSTERAALVDAARSQGNEALVYWEDVYKETPIVSPIDGGVIVRAVEPGQTVETSDVVLVLSDYLIISAQFDETDIGKVAVGSSAFITLDAYPDIKIKGIVDHIAHESEIVNNVTIYDVGILPVSVPDIVRSGMSVSVEVVETQRSNVVLIPSSAIHYDEKRDYVLVKERSGRIVERAVTVGLNNDKIAEIVSGLTIEDTIIVAGSAYLPKKKDNGTNPFMPTRNRNDRAK